MNAHAVICTACGPVSWAESYARARVVADQHYTVRGCFAHVSIKAYR